MPGPQLVPNLEQLARFVRSTAPDDRPLEQVARAVELQVHLADLTDRLLGHFVNEARRAGESWTKIGDVLGVSKQAAHQRQQARWAVHRLSEEAEAAFEAARTEAHQLRHNYVGTEHLLLGLLAEPKVIARSGLLTLGLSLERLREQVIELLSEGNSSSPLPPSTLTPRARKVMDIALKNSLASGHTSVYSPHLAMAFLEAKEGIASDLLESSGIDLRSLETALRPLIPDRREVERTLKAQADQEADALLPSNLQEAARQPKIPAHQMDATVRKARAGDTQARQALVKHFLERTANLALELRPDGVARHEAVAHANGALLGLANDPPEADFETALEEAIRRRMQGIGTSRA